MGGYVCGGGGAVILITMHLIICMSMTVVVDGGHPVRARKKVAVEGVVYCQDCTRDPNNSFQLVATRTPLAGALLKLQCNNTIRKTWEQEMKADSKGEFLLKTERVSSWGVHKCKLFLLSSPQLNCSSKGNPEPDAPWIFGHPLKPITNNSSSSSSLLSNNNNNIQFYTTDSPLLFYPHWSTCT